MKKNFALALSLSIATVIGVSTNVFAQPNIIYSFPVKGGDSKVNSGKDPNIQIQEIQKGNVLDPNRQTWIVIHGWNGDPAAPDFTSLAETIKDKKPNDRVLMLDWKEASSIGVIPGVDTKKAATWISPVAEGVFKKLSSEGVLPQNLNLVGQSLGALLSSEIGKFFVDNNSGVKINRIIALDPASELVGKYDIDGSKEGDQHMTDFRDVATISKAFVGNTSAAGDKTLAATAGESYTMQFNQEKNPATGAIGYGRIGGIGSEHSNVVVAYNNLIKNGLPGEDGNKNILGLDSGNNTNIQQDAYDDKFEGRIIVNNTDSNKPYRLYVKNPRTSEEIVFGESDQKTKIKKNADEALQTLSGNGCDPYSAGTWIAWILSLGSIKACAASASAENQDLSPQLQNQLMLSNINGITQSGVSSIGSPSTSFISHNPIVDASKPRPENIQEKNQYTNGTIVKAPLDIGLTWNQSTNLDLDSHTVTPSGDHVYFVERGSLTNTPNTFLYRDSIPPTRLGAEQTRITTFQEGEYRFYVYNYSDQGNLFPSGLPNSAAKVQLFQGGAPLTDIPNDPNVFDLNNPALQKVGQPYPGTNTFNVPTNQSGNTWYVFKLNTRTGILNRVDRIGNINGSSNVPKFIPVLK